MTQISSNLEFQLGLASLPLDDVRIGVTLNSPIFDAKSEPPKLVLAAGTVLTEGLITQLDNRSITTIRVAHQELVHISKSRKGFSLEGSPESDELSSSLEMEGFDTDQQVQEESHSHSTSRNSGSKKKSSGFFNERKPGSRWGCTKDSFLNQLQHFSAENYDPILVSHFKREFTQNVRQTEHLFANVFSDKIRSADTSIEIAESSLECLKDDTDLFLNINLSSHEYSGPWKHGLQCSMLAMSIATYLGLSETDIQELALGCLLHEVGTLRLNPKYSYIGHQLSKLEYLELTKHPGITMDTIRKWPDMPGTSCLIAYQIHERCDGSGYPNGRSNAQLHYLSKIAAVADTYITLTTDHPNMKALLPYHAIEQILYQARQGKFDPDVVRGLLHAVSLFPIGSYIELSDSRVGRILRSNQDEYIRPVCEIWFRDDPVNTKTVVDLHDESDLFILRPLEEVPLPATPVEPVNTDVISDSSMLDTEMGTAAGNPEQPIVDEETLSILSSLNL